MNIVLWFGRRYHRYSLRRFDMPRPEEMLNSTLRDRYVIERQLGQGGMAVVWLATDVRHHRTVALKVLRPEFALSGLADRFLKETQVLAELQHPHILPLLDSGAVPAVPGGEATCPFLVMPWIRGESLRERLSRDGPLSLDAIIAIVGQVAGALDYAHGRGVVHRDVKPENILLDGDNAYLADFGIASALEHAGGTRLTETGLTLGTPAYMSPEQSAAERHIDGRSDEYSLACVAYEMLAGEPPFSGPTAQAIMAKRFAGPPPSISILRPSLPPQVAPALARALAQAPADRFPTAGSLAAALAAGDAAVARSTGRRPQWTRAMLPALLAAVSVVLAIALLLARRARVAHPLPNTHDAAVIQLRDRGERAYDQRTEPGVAEAASLYVKAIERDSTYADAWNGLARTYVRAHIWAFDIPGVPRDSLLFRAARASEGAFVADSNLASTWTTRATVLQQLVPTSRRDMFRAVQRALKIAPNDAEAWRLYGIALSESDSLPAAVAAWRRAVGLQPGYVEAVTFLSLGHLWMGQYDSAAAWADSGLGLNPTLQNLRTAAGFAALARHDPVRAEQEFTAAEHLGRGPELIGAIAGVAMARAAAGDTAAAKAILLVADSTVMKSAAFPLHAVVFLAEGWAALGDGDRAFAWLARFADPRDLHFQLHLRHDPAMNVLHSDARLTALLGGP